MEKIQPHFLTYVKQKLQPDEVMNNFFLAVSDLGITLYPAQEDAILEIFSDKNVILSTPTGSGKSLVALAMHFKGLCENKRSFYTSPIKALASEKFFDLCQKFGKENVGMITGDASINKDANIICCTAEVLANYSLRGEDDNINYVIMDEFHYYSDQERGFAWQLPLLTLKKTQFLLMSATIGDCPKVIATIEKNTKKKVATIHNTERPVPLDFSYRETPIHETLADMLSQKKYPIYVVNFTQRECQAECQNAMSVNICTKEEKKVIQKALEGFRFDTPFGKDVKKYLSHGVGIHHAGLLPKYRLLCEKLAQSGLLKIIMGTDTLGVGVNVPIRTVIFTKLCKFDGSKTGILSVRDFKQIAGRAGRKGFDDEGSVIAQAPAHVIENKRAAERVSAGKQKSKRGIPKKAPPKNFMHYDENTFLRLIQSAPEPLVSRFTINHGTIINALSSYVGNANPGFKRLIGIINDSHETDKNKSSLRKTCAMLFKSLVAANLITIVKNIKTGSRIQANENLQSDFSLHHTLSLYLIEALNGLDKEDETYAIDVLSLCEAIEENPKAILIKMLDKKKDEEMAKMKADGLDYDARMEKLEKIEIDKPLADFIYQSFNEFKKVHPWVLDNNVSPKSIMRDIYERAMSFNEYTKELGIQRSEGLLLRYISQSYKTIVQTIPDEDKTEDFFEIIAYFRSMLEKVDSSLIDEWENLFASDSTNNKEEKGSKAFDPAENFKLFAAKIRADLFYFVKYLSDKDYESAANVFSGLTNEQLSQIFDKFYSDYEYLISDYRSKDTKLTTIKKLSANKYEVIHTLLDDKEDNMWHIKANVTFDIENNKNNFIITHIGD